MTTNDHRNVEGVGDRVKAAQANALRRFQREGRQLAPLRWWLVGIVVVVAATSRPSLGFSGRHLALTLCLAVFVLEMLGWPTFRPGVQSVNVLARASELAVMGASAIALVALQPAGVSELPGSAVVFMAGVALAPRAALWVGGAVTAGVAVALAVAEKSDGASIAASILLCAVLGITGSLLRRYRISQEQTELLLAQLEEARDDQARAAVAEERASIARDLHDVLAHSLSGLSIQLEMIRKMTSTSDLPPEVRAAIDGAADLAKQGLGDAREAVGVLRSDQYLGVSDLPALIEHYARDLALPVTLHVYGDARPLSPDVQVALYRVAGEALTNVTRHAQGAATTVELFYRESEVELVVSNLGGQPSSSAAEGSGWGLAGVRERIKRLDGEFSVKSAENTWTVSVSVPA